MNQVVNLHERASIEKQLSELNEPLRDLENYVLSQLSEHHEGEGQRAIRFVVPRRGVKSLDSIVRKIERWRMKECDSTYSFDQVHDLIGAKVLCPYPTDVEQVARWLYEAERPFSIEPTIETAREQSEEYAKDRGYRGLHFRVRKKTSPHSRPCVKFEIQVKTLLEKAWDAKTHEVSYKREEEIDKDLLKHMKLLSEPLVAIDSQTEVVKDQILRDETLRLQRRAAATFSSLIRIEPNRFEKYGFPKNAIEDPSGLVTRKAYIRERLDQLEEAEGLGGALCTAYAVLSLASQRADDRVTALQKAVQWVGESDPQSPEYLRTQGTAAYIHGCLGDPLTSFTILEKALDVGEAQQSTDAGLMDDLRSNYVYFTADFRDSSRKTRASRYLSELNSTNPAYVDTIGFFKIVFGEQADDIEDGRKLVRESNDNLKGTDLESTSDAFYAMHEELALGRLLEMLSRTQARAS